MSADDWNWEDLLCREGASYNGAFVLFWTKSTPRLFCPSSKMAKFCALGKSDHNGRSTYESFHALRLVWLISEKLMSQLIWVRPAPIKFAQIIILNIIFFLCTLIKKSSSSWLMWSKSSSNLHVIWKENSSLCFSNMPVIKSNAHFHEDHSGRTTE